MAAVAILWSADHVVDYPVGPLTQRAVNSEHYRYGMWHKIVQLFFVRKQLHKNLF
jgi:hypothetical protein